MIKRTIAILMILFVFAGILSGCGAQTAQDEKIAVKVLILPKFEIGEMSGDYHGEAQYYYEGYVENGDEYDIEGCVTDTKLYYKDGVALCLLGQGKVSAALNMTAILSDERFDFSDAYIVSVGCAGSAEGYGIMGDVYVITASADNEG